MTRGPLAVILLGLLVAASIPTVAQGQQNRQREAARHFDSGIELFNEGRHEAALVEFRRAHQLAPAPAVLYNLARVHAALGHAVESVDAYEQYLRGSRRMPRQRRAEVNRALRTQRGRIGLLTVETNVEGSVIRVDGIDLTTTPMPEPARVTAGRLNVSARAPGYEEISRAIEIAGGVERTIRIELRPESQPRGTVHVTSPVPGVLVMVDGEEVGSTPLDRTLPLEAGRHVVEGVRPGYLAERHEVDLADGSEVQVLLTMGRDPATARENLGRLRLSLPEAACSVKIDDQAVETRGGSVELVAGPHAMELVCAERETYRSAVDVPSGGSLDLAPALEWTPDARAARLDRADDQRGTGLWFTVPGVLVLGGSLATLVWNEGEISDTDRLRAERQDAEDVCSMPPIDPDCARQADMRYGSIDDLNGDADRQNLIRYLTIGGTVLGAAATAVGVYLLAEAPTERSVDGAAHASASPQLWFGVGAGSATISGTF